MHVYLPYSACSPLGKDLFLVSDAFVKALRRFISHRGKHHTFLSDNGTNLVRDYYKLRRSLHELDQAIIKERLKCEQIR